MHPPKPRLLLVDDNPSNLIALEAVLNDQYELITAESGKAAIQILTQYEVAVVLLDVQMPEMDGFETARQIKQLRHCQNLPIIFITAVYHESPFIKRGYEAGALDYFSKPFDPEILKMKVGIYASYQQKVLLLKEREQRIADSEELLKAGKKLSALLESLPVGVIIADADGRIGQTNEEILRIWKSNGIVETDAYGDFLEWWNREGQIIRSEDGPLSRALRGESTHNLTMEITCFDHTTKTAICAASPLRKIGGEVVGAVLVIQDITEHRKIESDFEDRILKIISLGVEIEQRIPH